MTLKRRSDSAETPRLVLRTNGENPNHHMWNNQGVWWCNMTIHQYDGTSERHRFSLKTRDVKQARDRRDRIFRDVRNQYTAASA